MKSLRIIFISCIALLSLYGPTNAHTHTLINKTRYPLNVFLYDLEKKSPAATPFTGYVDPKEKPIILDRTGTEADTAKIKRLSCLKAVKIVPLEGPLEPQQYIIPSKANQCRSFKITIFEGIDYTKNKPSLIIQAQ